MRYAPLLAAALAAAPIAAAAQDAAGRNLAAACAICHGTDGRAATPNVTPLAGLPKDTIAAQLRAFRDGKRPATVMHQIAKGYTDEQIELLAGWFAAQKR
jgi:cytochrome subunit of sulfide dehydrogenase